MFETKSCHSNRWRIVAGLFLIGTVAGLCSYKFRIPVQLFAAHRSLIHGDLGRATRDLELLRKEEPQNPRIYYLLARAYRRQGLFELVEPNLRMASQLGYADDPIVQQRYLLLFQSGRIAEADPFIKGLLARGCDDELAEEIYEAQAAGFLRIYRLGDALICLDHWLQWRPHRIQARLWRAQIFEHFDRWQSASDEYRAILTYAPSRSDVRRKYAQKLAELNQVGQAIMEYQTCLAKDPRDWEAECGLADCFWRSGDAVQAERIYRKLGDKPMPSTLKTTVAVNLARIHLDRNATAEATELLESAVAADPYSHLALSILAAAYLKAGRVDDGKRTREVAEGIKRQFDRLTELTCLILENPEDPDLRFEAGQILMAQNLKEEGKKWWDTALLVDPYHEKSQQALADYLSTSKSSRATP